MVYSKSLWFEGGILRTFCTKIQYIPHRKQDDLATEKPNCLFLIDQFPPCVWQQKKIYIYIYIYNQSHVLMHVTVLFIINHYQFC
jgi:hypothetical protein